MRIPIAIVIASLLIAASILFIFRWQIVGVQGANGNPGAIRLDRWTGEVADCAVDVQRTLATNSPHFHCASP